MTNYEKYKDEIDKAVANTHNMYEFLNMHRKEIDIVAHEDGDRIPDIQMLRFVVWLQQEYKEPEVDWRTVKVDEKILVRNNDEDKWEHRHFSKYKDGKIYCFSYGCTSWSSDYEAIWLQGKLGE